MDLQKYKIIVELAKVGSISKASENLFISQPTLSLTLQKIESQIGYPLFERGRSGLTPTFAGKLYIDLSKRIIEMKNETDIEINEHYNNEQKKITLGISKLWSKILLPKILPPFYEKFQNVEVNIHLSTSEYLTNLLLDNKIDVAIVSLILDVNTNNGKINYIPIFDEDIIVAMSSKNPLTKKAVHKKGYPYPYIAPELLANEKFILSPENYRLRQSADSLFRSYNITPNIVMIDSTVETTAVLASIGIGVTFLPKSFVETYTNKNELVCFSTCKTLLPWTIALAYKNSIKSSTTKKFISSTYDLLHNS